jgi:2-polyprenyl-3-methyl-5-hydroxy-6-metoxy-1,4-benzoquinol methylase
MMTSFPENIPIILNLAVALRPTQILDVGPGFGKFGLMLREALLSIRAEEKNEAFPVQQFIIDCAESCQYFISQPWHKVLYEHHYHGNILDFKFEALKDRNYDLFLMVDVVEHAPKERWLAWIRDARVAFPKARFLISTPKQVCFYKTHFYGSDCPIHQSQWCWDDFNIFPVDFVDTKNSMIVVIR